MADRRYPFDVFDEMDRMMESMRRSMYEGVDDVRSWGARSGAHLSVDRDGDHYVVLADLPGFEKEEIDLRFHDGMLHLAASHEVSESDEHGALSRSRRVNESVRVPGEVVEDGIEATYRNGVLEVRLPALDDEAEDDSRRIDID
ncbi:Hsp20/alpha crystallin family protein [Halosegnis marinus]|uniref:Hsp20/alpha crystallin family protein n=1 Tax=Halosegnis marinus TaxID=3034023 RepID=A0ABD5ZSD8_9EURY|nr:Hsp20/alpha crystallin family protein [Halosegnis sp. DT85]